MRIAVITSSYPRFEGDGTAPFVRSLSEAMIDQGHQLEVVAPYDVNVNNVDKSKVNVTRFKYIFPYRYHVLGHARSLEDDGKLRPLVFILLPLYLFFGAAQLIKVICKQKSEIIHAHWLLPSGLIALCVSKIKRIPYIVSMHGSDVYVSEKNRIFSIIAKAVLENAAGVSACSLDLKNREEAISNVKNIKIITGGADPRIFRPDIDKRLIRKSLSLPSEKVIVCSIGRMVSKKGFNILIQAFAAIVNKNHNSFLFVGGDGPLRNKLISQANELGISKQVLLPGNINWELLPRYLAASDIFVLPSIIDKYGNVDGLPTILLEAMACGLPCVVSDIGGVRLVIGHGRNGLIVTPGSIHELESSIDSLINDKDQRERFGLMAHSDATNNFSWNSISKQFEILISQSSG